MPAKPRVTENEIRQARRWIADGESVRGAARRLGYGTDGHKSLQRRIDRQARAEQEASTESQQRARQRYRDREQATRHGQPWVTDGVTAEDVAEAGAALGVDPVPDPQHVPAEFSPPDRVADRDHGPAPRESFTIRRRSDGTMYPDGAPELPDGVERALCLTMAACSRAFLVWSTNVRQTRFVLSCAVAEGRLLPHPKYSERFQQLVASQRVYIWPGVRSEKEIHAFARWCYSSRVYQPPGGTTKILSVYGPAGGGDDPSDAELQWRDERAQALREYEDRDTRRFQIRRSDTDEVILTTTGEEHARERGESHGSRLGTDVYLQEVPR
jgi:hypothetical protein